MKTIALLASGALLLTSPVIWAADALPSLKIVAPAQGAKVSSQVYIDLESNGHLPSLTMGESHTTHLHVEMDGEVLMPMKEDLQALGGRRWRYRFDLPAKPGAHTLKAYWSDHHHQTIAASVQQVKIVVDPQIKPSQK